MLEFFKENWQVILYVFVALAVFVLNLKGDKKGVNKLMKFLNEHDSAQLVKSSEQKFDNLKQVYRLNKVTNILEPTDDYIDIDEVIESCRNQTLDYILEKFLPGQDLPVISVEEGIQEEINGLQDDLDTLRDMNNIAEEYRERFNLSSDMSISDIYNFINNQSLALKEKLQKSKEVVKDEKAQTVEESK